MVDVATFPGLRIFSLVIFTVFGVAIFQANAANINIGFQTVFNDTAPGEIKVITQDSEGFIWFGARNAVLKYNAYDFVPIKYLEEKDGKKTQVSPYYTTDIFEDREGTIWITSHSGLFRYDRNLNLFIKPSPVNETGENFFNRTLQDVDQLPSGELVVGGDGAGFVFYDPKLNSIVWRHAGTDDESNTADLSIQKFLIDSKNRFWFSNNSGLNLFNVDSKKSELFVPNPENPTSKADNSLTTLLEDRNGNILGGTVGKGLYEFNPVTEKFTNYVHQPDKPTSIPENTIWNLMEDREGIVWLAHDRSNFSWFDTDKKVFKTYKGTVGTPGSLAYSAVRSIYEDRNGDIWVGHYPGKVSFHDRSTSAIHVYRNKPGDLSSINAPNVLAVMEDAKANLWLAVGGMVERLDRKSETFKRYNAGENTYPAHGTLSGFIDSVGTIYIGTWTEGYYIYNPVKDLFEAQKVDPGLAASENRTSHVLNDATIWTFCETRDGSRWIGTHYAGISQYNQETGTFKKYQGGNTALSITNNIAWSCLEDSKGRFWVGTAWGANIIDYKNDAIKKYWPSKGADGALQGGSITSIVEDNQGRLWFGSNEGLHLYNEATDNFTVFKVEDGLSNNSVRAITIDKEGDLWLGTDKGITRFNPETKATKQYLSDNGIEFSGVNRGAALTTQKGEIVFGTVNELIIINPTQLVVNKTPPHVVFSGFKLFAKPVPINGPDNLLSKSINQTSEIILDYTQRMVSFEFAALSYRAPDKNMYAYKLDGFDQEWREVEHQREAQYTNLSAGKYTFMVKASNNDGVWNEQPKTINLIQLPPPWKTWWAYSIYAAITLFILAYFVQSQRRKRQQVEIQNRILEEKVVERTARLAEKNRDIQSMLINMRQGLFTINQDLTIHQEYSSYLENIYEQEKIAGEDAFIFLFGQAKLSNDKRHQIEASMNAIIGMDTMNYKFNGHLLIREYNVNLNNKNKALTLDWDPIVDEDIVTKLMVSVRDVTKLKAMEFEAAEKKRDLEIIGQLINTKSAKYLNFNNSAHRYLDECQKIIESVSSGCEEDIRSLYRAMHTIKGNGRTLAFTYIAELAHEAENRYAQILSGNEPWNTAELLKDIANIRDIVDLYFHIYRTVLGRGEDKSRDSDGAWFDGKTLSVLQSSLKKIETKYPEIYNSIEELIHEKTTLPLSEVLQDNIRALESIAKELNKNTPKVVVEENGVRVQAKFQDLFTDVFSHLFRNSIDHGIELPDLRVKGNKNPTGLITVTAQAEPDTVYLYVTDDGAGLDLLALFNKGVERGGWGANDKISIGQLAQSIFNSGTTTKTSVSNISGRGVGLDAVKQFLENAGGDIGIDSDSLEKIYDPKGDLLRLQFSFKLTLPKYFVV